MRAIDGLCLAISSHLSGVWVCAVQVGSIASEYRTFQYEVLAGDSNLDVEVREGGAVFAFNYAEVHIL